MDKRTKATIGLFVFYVVSANPAAALTCDSGSLDSGGTCNITGTHDITGQEITGTSDIVVKSGGRLYTNHKTLSNSPTASISLNDADFIVESGGAVHANINISGFNIKVKNGGVIDATGLGWQAASTGTGSCKFGQSPDGYCLGGGVNDAKTTSNNFSYISVGVAYQENMINDSSSEPSKFVPNEYTEYNLTRKKADEKSYSGSTYTLEANFQANLTDEYTLDSGDNPQDVTVNVTGLNYGNHSRTGDPLSNSHKNATLVSGGAFNSPATLSDGDKLTVTHEITISDGS